MNTKHSHKTLMKSRIEMGKRKKNRVENTFSSGPGEKGA
jgi:hypothetical protein